MAENKKPGDPLDIDDLLDELTDDTSGNDVEASTTSNEETSAEVGTTDDLFADPEPEPAPAETEEEARIRELEAQLAAPSPFEVTLTPAQLRIRELEQQLAEKNQRALEEAENAPVEYDTPSGTGETILLHFLEDGLLVCGQTWYRGQELEFEVGSKAHQQQFDRNGKTWLDLLDDIDGQYSRWGKQYIASGPWRGKKWEDAPVPAEMTDPAEIEAYKTGIKKAAANERKRNRAAPVIR